MVRERPLKLRNAPIPATGEGHAGLATLAGTAFAACFLQFFTGLFETWPALGTLAAAGELLLGAGVALQGLREARAARRLLHLAAGCTVAIAAGWILQAKISYPGTLLSHPRYTAPHMPFPYGEGARLVRLTCADGVGIDGMYLAGRQTSAIILYPGWIGGKDGLAISSLARWLSPHFQVLVLDPRGSGGSGGFQRGAGDGKLDISAAAAFLHDKGATRIGVLAEGDGSLAAALAAAEDPAINALLLAGPTATWGEARPGDSGWDDPRSAFGRIYWRVAAGIRLARASGPALADVLPKVAPRPLLIVSHPGEAARTAEKLFLAASEPRGLRLLPGSGRPLDWGAYPAYLGAVRDWFRLVLAPDTSTGANAVAGSVAEGDAGARAIRSDSGAGSAPSGSGSAAMREARATPSPDERELEAILGEPQPLVPALPGLPERAVEAGAASAAAQVPVLPKPVSQVPALPAPPVGGARLAEGHSQGARPASGQPDPARPAPDQPAVARPSGVVAPSRAAAP